MSKTYNLGQVKPIKGVDYYTDAEKSELVNEVASKIDSNATAWVKGSLYLTTAESSTATVLDYLGGEDNIDKVIGCIDNKGVLMLNNIIETTPYLSPIEYVIYTWSESVKKIGVIFEMLSSNTKREIKVDLSDTAAPLVYGVVDGTLSSAIIDVPEWAQQDTKPTYTADEVGAMSEEDVTTAINNAITNAITEDY